MLTVLNMYDADSSARAKKCVDLVRDFHHYICQLFQNIRAEGVQISAELNQMLINCCPNSEHYSRQIL